MTRSLRQLWLLSFAICALPAFDESAPSPASKEEIFKELASAPKKNTDREKAVANLFRQAGATEKDVVLQDVEGTDADNVMVVKTGESSAFIVVGGHLDKVAKGDGIIDDWSGTTLVTNLYQALKNVKTRHTIKFIAFAGEEQGLLGSKAHVAKMSDDEKKNCKAMLNLECVGIDGPHCWTNGSTDALEKILHEVADREKISLKDHEVRGVGADSMSFEKIGVPVITIDGTPQKYFRYLHSPADTIDKINKDNYHTTYILALKFLVTLDETMANESEKK